MGRPDRYDYRGAWHHVVNRGARRAPIFKRDDHCGLFLSLLAETAKRYRLEVHTYALMSNHYHLLLRSPEASLSRGMAYFGGEYTRAVNRLHDWDGPVFKSRFASQVVEDTEHLLAAFGYIHLNPVRAGLIRRVDQAYWTSYRAYIDKDVPPEWLHREPLLSMTGGQTGFIDFIRDLRSGRVEWPDELNLDTGFFDLPDAEPLKRRNIRDPKSRKVAKPTVILKRVCGLTKSSVAALKRAQRGRGANPARRFAIWALSHSGMLTYREIGKLLNASIPQVGNSVRSVRTAKSGEIALWVDYWETKYGI